MKLNPDYKYNLDKIEELYLTAFPAIERKPFDLIFCDIMKCCSWKPAAAFLRVEQMMKKEPEDE